MEVKILKLGYLFTNVYILKKDGYSLIIDPADDYKTILKEVEGTKPLGILLTHTHDDHTGALKDLIDNDIKELDYNEFMEIGPFKFKIINTPGHTSDSKTFYFEDEELMFTGDFLFYDSVGRTDLETGDYAMMQKSIDLIKNYPDCTVYPGHGISTTLQREKDYNLYFIY